MSYRVVICFAVVLIVSSPIGNAAEPDPNTTRTAAPKWRAATEADIRAMQARAKADAVDGAITTAEQAKSESDPAQRVFIDPATNEQVPAPVVPPQPETAGAPTPTPDFRLQRSPEGFLYIDTSGYQHFETATLHADGSVAIDCNIPGHAHAVEAIPADPASASPASDTQEPQQ